MARINFRQLSTAQFEALTVKDKNTQYEVFDEGDTEGKIYLGDVLMGGGGSQPTNETVQIAFTTSSGTIDWTQYQVTVKRQNQADQQVAIDTSGNCQFTVPLGESYTISYPQIPDYLSVPDVTYTALIPTRVLSVQYKALADYSRSVILERSNPADWTTSGSVDVVDYFLNVGTYVIDDVHKKYAKLDPLNHSQFADGTAWSGTYGDSFKHLPRVYYRLTTNTDNEPVLTIATASGGEGWHFWEDSWIGTYKGSVQGGVLVSRPNVTTTQSMTITAFFNAAQTHTEGTDYGLVSYFDQCKILALMYAKFGNANSETIMGGGLQNTSPSYLAHTTGTTAALGDATGQMQYLNTTYYMCKLFGIEDLAGSTFEFRQNIRFDNSQCIVYEGNIISNSATGRTFSKANDSLANTYITKMVLGEYCDFFPFAGGGSSVTYYCDTTYTYQSSGEIMRIGGVCGAGVLAGIHNSFNLDAFNAANADVGARLAFKGDISEYELVDGATLAQLNS